MEQHTAMSDSAIEALTKADRLRDAAIASAGRVAKWFLIRKTRERLLLKHITSSNGAATTGKLERLVNEAWENYRTERMTYRALIVGMRESEMTARIAIEETNEKKIL